MIADHSGSEEMKDGRCGGGGAGRDLTEGRRGGILSY